MRAILVRRGASVVGLLTGPPAAKGIPHLTGVRTIGGEEVSADLIVDAMPWYRDTIAINRPRLAQLKAFIEGRPEPQPAPTRQ